MLGQVDLAFLGAYALGMFFAGHLGDRLDLRWFLSAGGAVDLRVWSARECVLVCACVCVCVRARTCLLGDCLDRQQVGLLNHTCT